MKGIFITFEGCEGSGKSTHSQSLYAYLKERGLSVIHIREPGGTKIGEQIRKILLNPKNKIMDPVSETLLYMASRMELVRHVIKPALKHKKIVICDRFLDSTRAYQGCGLGVDIRMIEYLGEIVTAGITPDLTVFLDLSTRTGLKRAGTVRDRIERRAISYHQRVRKAFLGLARRQPKRIKIIRAHHDKQITQLNIRKVVLNFIRTRGHA